MLLQVRLSALSLLALLCATSGLAATFTTVDISSYVNSNIAVNPQTIPVGTTNGNQSTGIPFNIATYNGLEGTWNASSSPTGVVDVAVNIPGQASFYALLNNYYGTPGADEYDVTIRTTIGHSVTYQSVGGVDTRDYNQNIYTNKVASSTRPWYDNGIGQRLDLREFSLPASFQTEAISDFIITQRTGDYALLTGITFSTEPIATPEPFSFGMFAIGAVAIAILYFQCRRSEGVSNLRQT